MSADCSLCGARLKVGGKSWTFTIPVEAPSQNVVAANHGPGRFRYAKIRNELVAWINAAKRSSRISAAKGRRRVIVLRQYGSRGKVRDRGNLIGGCKPLIDALTIAGLIVDDSPEWIEDHYAQERAAVAATVITIEDLDR